ncbi:hypothetical protein [Vibrio palustris]|uniref:Lumazine protein n=1 Tax=Vibrio palustris TaxID=1918946 RepID=A0A1R4B295_9VIBR|nr:hypothetical protein [Vibrio palustris]SJL83029.1 Lumazine protein [Vibrio palustris]
MFTNFARSMGKVVAVERHSSVIELGIQVHQSLCAQFNVGAHVIVDGMKLSVSRCSGDVFYCQFDQALSLSTLSNLTVASFVHVFLVDIAASFENSRAVCGRIDFQSHIRSMVSDNEQVLIELSVPVEHDWLNKLRVDTYLAVNGIKGIVCEIDNCARVMTVSIAATTNNTQVLNMKFVGDQVNIEIERLSSKALKAVDERLSETLGELYPTFQQLLKLQGTSMESLAFRAKAKLHQNTEDTKQTREHASLEHVDVSTC